MDRYYSYSMVRKYSSRCFPNTQMDRNLSTRLLYWDIKIVQSCMSCSH